VHTVRSVIWEYESFESGGENKKERQVVIKKGETKKMKEGKPGRFFLPIIILSIPIVSSTPWRTAV
jgi:hypothetical protein